MPAMSVGAAAAAVLLASAVVSKAAVPLDAPEVLFPVPATVEFLSENGRISEEAGTATCWSGAKVFTWEFCCKAVISTARGFPGCWQDGFDYERCCVPEFKLRVEQAQKAIDEGDVQRTSHALYDLLANYARPSGDAAIASLVFQVFERASRKYLNYLDRLPRQLSYFEVLFHGSGIECEPVENSTALEDLTRCCRFFHGVCDSVFQMIALAMGHKMRNSPGGEDAYYKEFSEHWAFHHFTPTLFQMTDLAHDGGEHLLQKALEMNPDITEALSLSGDPKLGTLWAEHERFYQSSKFFSGVFHLTEVLNFIQNREGARPIHFFEVGAGFGMVAYLLASSRPRLLQLSRPLDVQSWAAIDYRSASDLQRWYLNRTLGDRVEIRRWPAEASHPDNDDEFHRQPDHLPGRQIWPPGGRAREAPLLVELVPHTERDLFVHAYGQAHGAPAAKSSPRPLRVLIAVNSWHEFSFSEYYWYFNTFVAGPEWFAAADYIYYVANNEWHGNAEKERMLTSWPGFEVLVRRELHKTVWHLLRRTAA